MNSMIEEIRLNRAFVCAFFDALKEGKIEAPKDVMDKFMVLKKFYDEQLVRELS